MLAIPEIKQKIFSYKYFQDIWMHQRDGITIYNIFENQGDNVFNVIYQHFILLIQWFTLLQNFYVKAISFP